MNTTNLNNLITTLGKFKDLKRTGWINKQVNQPESDAEHSFSLAILAMLLVPQGYNKLRCLELALTHDLAEIYAGDITPYDNISKEDKLKTEQQAISQITKELNWPQLKELFDEYNNRSTNESIFINALDKIDNVITASYYDQSNRSPQKLVPEFANHANQCLNMLTNRDIMSLKNILKELTERK